MKTAIGLMSGTSMDAIDVALVRTDGREALEFGPGLSVAYSPADRRLIEAALEDAKAIGDRAERPGLVAQAEVLVTERHIEAVKRFISENDIANSQVDVIGFHGQTVLHRPEEKLTVQIGDGQALADALGIDVIFDFRANDVAAGGQGAPLVPVFHRALAAQLDTDGPIAFVNIGGIANVTLLDGEGEPKACDTGPGNALIDQWVQAKAGLPYDQAGAIASEGQIDDGVVADYLAHPFLEEDWPKSLDRFDFAPLDPSRLPLADGARTLAAVTAQTIHASCKDLATLPTRWIISGGGRLNRSIMDDLAALAEPDGATVESSDALNFDGDLMEAQAFAYLAVRSMAGEPLTFPMTTGVRKPITGGVLARARRTS